VIKDLHDDKLLDLIKGGGRGSREGGRMDREEEEEEGEPLISVVVASMEYGVGYQGFQTLAERRFVFFLHLRPLWDPVWR
jgi:hypothetical protein